MLREIEKCEYSSHISERISGECRRSGSGECADDISPPDTAIMPSLESLKSPE